MKQYLITWNEYNFKVFNTPEKAIIFIAELVAGGHNNINLKIQFKK